MHDGIARRLAEPGLGRLAHGVTPVWNSEIRPHMVHAAGSPGVYQRISPRRGTSSPRSTDLYYHDQRRDLSCRSLHVWKGVYMAAPATNADWLALTVEAPSSPTCRFVTPTITCGIFGPHVSPRAICSTRSWRMCRAATTLCRPCSLSARRCSKPTDQKPCAP